MKLNVEPSGVDTHEQGGGGCYLLWNLCATPAMAKGTASVEPTGGAEKATAVKLEALEPGAYGKAGSRRERWPLQGEASHGAETPPRQGMDGGAAPGGCAIDVMPCVETSLRRGRKTSRTSSYIEAVSGSWLISNDRWVQSNHLEKYSCEYSTCSRTGDKSSRANCEGPTSPAHAAAMAQRAREKVALVVGRDAAVS